MMAIMRKLIDTKVYKIILWLFLFMMAVGSGIMLNVGTEKKWVIKVYQDTMTASRFDALLRSVRDQKEMYRQKGIILAGKNVEKEAVLAAVSELLKQHAMSDLHMAIPASVVEQKVNEVLAGLPQVFFKENGDLNEELFLRAIAPQSIEEFLENVSISVCENLLSSLISVGSYTPSFELEQQHIVEFAKKEYSVLKLSGQKFLAKAKESAVSEEALEKFYKKSKNNESFRTQERRSGTLWKFTQESCGTSVSQGDIKKEYEKNKKDYQTSPSLMQVRALVVLSELGAEEVAREKVERLHKQAEAKPEDFASLVKEFSDDKASAKNGGLTKLFTQDDTELDKAIVKTAFESLITDGQISTPIKIENGYVLIQRVKRNPAQYKELHVVSDDIAKNLKDSKFKQRFMQDANRAVSQVRYTPELLQKFIEKGHKSELPLTTKKASASINNLFKTEEGKYTVFFDKNEGYVLLCDQVEKSKIPALTEVKDLVKAKYYEQEASEQLGNVLLKMLQAARSSQDLKAVAKEFGATVEQAHFEFKNDSVEQSSILKDSAVQAKLKMLSHKGAMTSVVSQGDGLVISLDTIEDFDKTSLKNNDKFAKTMSYAKKYQVKEGFIASLYRRAKLDKEIEMKQEVSHLLKEA